MIARSLALVLIVLLALAAPASATTPPAPSPRAIGLAGNLRGAASGDAALSLNPSGMSTVRTYVLEAAYLHDQVGDATAHDAHVSVVDSTSGFNVAGGLYYTYLNDPGRSAHEGGAALSFPIGERFFLGGTARYLRVHNDVPIPGLSQVVSGFAFDVGATVKPIPILGIGLAATNVADASLSDRAPRTLGGGVSVGVTGELLLTFDAVYDISSSANKFWSYGGGGEYLFAKRLAVRAGGGRRGDTRAGVVGGGVSLISDVAALDAGVQADVSGSHKELLIGVSGRIFVPSP
jgi:hypothetical protein